jgi:co-chaperonin GroES (HSP10)
LSEQAFLNDEDVTIPEGIPSPQLWRMLVAPIKPRRESKGGIVLPDEALDAEATLTYIGKVVKCGPLVGKKPEWPEGGYDIKPGDWVVFGRHAGQRFEFKGVKLLLIDDDAIMAKADSPEGFRIYV